MEPIEKLPPRPTSSQNREICPRGCGLGTVIGTSIGTSSVMLCERTRAHGSKLRYARY